MITITMTTTETAIYDLGTEAQQRALMADLRARAAAARHGSETVEVCTADGIVVVAIQN